MKAIRLMDIGWGGVVSYHGNRCLQSGLDPDVDELERYNQAAKNACCPHDRRSRVVGDDGAYDYWYCLDCTSRQIPTPTAKDDGEFDLGGFIWRRTKRENG